MHIIPPLTTSFFFLDLPDFVSRAMVVAQASVVRSSSDRRP